MASRYAPYPTEDPPSSPWWYCTRVRIGRYCHGSSIGHQPLCRHDVAPDLDLVSSMHLPMYSTAIVLDSLYAVYTPKPLISVLYSVLCARYAERKCNETNATYHAQCRTHSTVCAIIPPPYSVQDQRHATSTTVTTLPLTEGKEDPILLPRFVNECFPSSRKVRYVTSVVDMHARFLFNTTCH